MICLANYISHIGHYSIQLYQLNYSMASFELFNVIFDNNIIISTINRMGMILSSSSELLIYKFKNARQSTTLEFSSIIIELNLSEYLK